MNISLIKILLLFFSFHSYKSYAQPIFNENEIVFSLETRVNAWENISKPKFEVAFLSSAEADENFQWHMVYKLQDDQAKAGGQVWLKLNKFLWVGGESVGNFNLDFDNQVLFAVEWDLDGMKIIPFFSAFIMQEELASYGAKIYFDSVSYGAEVKLKSFQKIKEFDVLVFMSFVINKDAVKEFRQLFKFNQK